MTARGSSDEQRECPRCGQQATATASRRGRCTACGAPLVLAHASAEANVRHYLYGPHTGLAAGRERAAEKHTAGND